MKSLISSIKRSLSRLPLLADFLCIIATASYFQGQFLAFAKDPGVGWHLKTGELIAASGKIPMTDPFLHGAERPWVSDQWLSDLILYYLYNAGSWPLLYAVFTIIALSTFMLVLYPAASRHSGSWLAGCIAAVFSLRLAQIHFILRPVGFSFLLFAICAAVLYRLHQDMKSGLNQIKPAVWVGLPLLFFLWANLHPSFVLGLLLIALLPISLILDSIFLDKQGAPGAPPLCLLLLLCALASLINPWGYGLHQSVLSLGSSEYFMRLNREWHSPDFSSHYGRLFEVIIFISLFSIFISRERLKGWSFFDLLPLTLFSCAGLQAARFFPYLGIVCAFPMARALAGLGGLRARFAAGEVWQRLCGHFSRLEKLEANSGKGRLVLLLIFALLLGDAILNDRLLTFKGPFGPPHDSYPYEAVKILKEESLHKPLAVASTPNWGGFISWQAYPQVRPVIDDRNTLLGEQAYKDYLEKLKPGQDWRNYLNSVEADYLLLEKDSSMAGALKEAGSLPLVYEDEVAILFRYERK